MGKIVETRSSLRNTIKDIKHKPFAWTYYVGRVYLDSIAKGTFCFHNFSHDASLHHHSFRINCFILLCIENAILLMRMPA